MRVNFSLHKFSKQDLLTLKDRKKSPSTIPIPGLPAPKIEVKHQKLIWKTHSWNSFEISSKSHNIGIFLVNPDPTQDATDNELYKIKSSLGSVVIQVTFKKSIIGEEFMSQAMMWLDTLVKWVELTANVHHLLLS